MTWTTASVATGVARSAGVPSTKTLMCGRSRGPASTSRSRMPGDGGVELVEDRVDRRAVDLVAARRGGEQGQEGAGQEDGGHAQASTTAASTAQISGSVSVIIRQALAFVAAVPQLARARPERDADRIERVAGHRLAEDRHEGVARREPVVVAGPRRAAVAGPPDGGVAVGHVAPILGRAERDHPAGRRVARVGHEREAEVGRQGAGDLLPRRAPSSER